jgi:SAM-dependent methyltransferase
MRGNEFHTFARYYDQIYLKRNDYKKESKLVRGIIRQFERKPSKTLLDVGCGTGEHLKYLSESYDCAGLDISREMIKAAKLKVSNARFKIADMINFRLKEKFDVIICLFSSIGYAQSFKNLVTTFDNFHKHLSEEGLVLVEPWVFKKDARVGTISIDTYDAENAKVLRMGTSRLTKSRWLVHFHYLTGINGRIKYEKETHKMILADYEDYVKAFNLSGYSQIKFLGENEWTRSRGLFVAMK